MVYPVAFRGACMASVSGGLEQVHDSNAVGQVCIKPAVCMQSQADIPVHMRQQSTCLAAAGDPNEASLSVSFSFSRPSLLTVGLQRLRQAFTCHVCGWSLSDDTYTLRACRAHRRLRGVKPRPATSASVLFDHTSVGKSQGK